jgi:hypothetical protein
MNEHLYRAYPRNIKRAPYVQYLQKNALLAPGSGLCGGVVAKLFNLGLLVILCLNNYEDFISSWFHTGPGGYRKQR